jgi:hypothetical protein
MPLGVALSDLRYQLRAETYNSLLPAHGVSSIDLMNAILERSQRELWNLYVWPHLRYHVDQVWPAGQRYSVFPTTMPFDQIVEIWYQDNANTQWLPITFGFGNDLYAAMGSETQQSYPPRRWRNVVDVVSGLTVYDGKMELWPIPSQGFNMRFEGLAPLNPLKVDADKCMIDSTAIILTAASELLGQNKSEVAAAKGQKAQAYIRRLLGKGANKRRIIALGQGAPNYYYGNQPTSYLDYIPG